MITNPDSGTRIDEIAERIYRITTPVTVVPGGFTFNQYLIVDDEPLLFHTGLRRLFSLVREAIYAVLPVDRLRYIGLSHYEADECGAMNEFLAAAPRAQPLCGDIAALVSIADTADRAPRPMADGETLSLGCAHEVRWFATPHLPHAWECGFLFETRTRTLLCGDLFTQGGAAHPPLTEDDILEPSEAFRTAMDYYSHTKNPGSMVERLAETAPLTLACMHGAAWRGDGSRLLRALGERLDAGAVDREEHRHRLAV
jgi:flavorubredoxin